MLTRSKPRHAKAQAAGSRNTWLTNIETPRLPVLELQTLCKHPDAQVKGSQSAHLRLIVDGPKSRTTLPKQRARGTILLSPNSKHLGAGNEIQASTVNTLENLEPSSSQSAEPW
jgi:hypothetical protein